MNKFIKFLQISDVHLDSSFSSSINFPVNKLEIRKSEHKSIITKVCQIVRDEDIDLVLIPGDLIDYESSTPDTTNFLIDNFSKISPVPIIITPGNHDYYSPSSVYNSDFLTGKQQNIWTENVFIFTAQKFRSISLPNLKEISITGISHYENRSFYNRLLTDNILKQEGKINILVFHGSRDGYCPSDKKITLPFSDEELFKLGFDYSAIGHYHSYLEILDEEGNIKGAYSGCPLGRNLREFGEKFFIMGKFYEDKKVEIEKRRIDHRIMLKIDVDCTGLNYNEQVLNIIAEKVKETTNSKEDIIYVIDMFKGKAIVFLP